MKDIDISGGDNNKIQTLAQAYSYEKDVVPFSSMVSLYNCSYLGGLEKRENIFNRIN